MQNFDVADVIDEIRRAMDLFDAPDLGLEPLIRYVGDAAGRILQYAIEYEMPFEEVAHRAFSLIPDFDLDFRMVANFAEKAIPVSLDYAEFSLKSIKGLAGPALKVVSRIPVKQVAVGAAACVFVGAAGYAGYKYVSMRGKKGKGRSEIEKVESGPCAQVGASRWID
ncbi:hypothetical protein [Sphingobium yanoikuyae]|jgi:hypothetical protein|uniref:hypothetical protein n=1 Tax=Sphingobium yanoikuyae TaxID=13690 RepID=UPI003F1151DE